MNILFISEYYPPNIKGGGEINLSLLAEELARQGNSVHILTAEYKSLPKIDQQGNLTIHRTLNTGSDPASLWSNIQRSRISSKITRETKIILRELPFDIIHCIGRSSIAAPSLQKYNIPLFATVESYPALCPKGDRLYHGKQECTISCTFLEFLRCQHNSEEIGKMKNKWYLKQNLPLLAYIYQHHQTLKESLSFCHCIAISSYVQHLLNKEGIESVVIPNALDFHPFSTAAQSASTSKNKKLQILYLGALLKSKGPQILLQALAGIPAHCDLYGDGSFKKNLLQKIKELKLDAEIHLPVPYSQIPALYRNADIVVFPSIWPEPFGRIPLEALASSTMIIASNIGGIAETLQGQNALLVTPGSVTELHAALQQASKRHSISKTPSSRKKIIQEKIIASLQQNYCPQRIADLHLAQYKLARRSS